MPGFSNRHITVSGNVKVGVTAVEDPEKPKMLTTICEFVFRDLKDRMCIPVCHFRDDGIPPEEGSIAFVNGQLFWPADESGERVEASAFQVICEPVHTKHFQFGPTHVFAVGIVGRVEGADWYIEVGLYDRVTRSNKTFNIVVTVPGNPRFKSLRAPRTGRPVSVCGILTNIQAHECAVTVELDAVTFISLSDPSHSSYAGTQGSSSGSSPGSSNGARSKREIISDQLARPMKQTKIGPAESFGGALDDFKSSSSESASELSDKL